MRIVPVIDLQHGRVVRGVAGRRHEYRPIVSRLTSSCQPAEVAGAFRDELGLTELYLADLDAIAGAPPALATYAGIQAMGSALWVDAGVRDAVDAATLVDAGVNVVVLGLETIRGPEMLRQVYAEGRSERFVFSLDLKDRCPLGDLAAWQRTDPWSIAEEAIAAGVSRILVLDLARVGVGGGVGTLELCTRLAETYPQVEIACGGGVNNAADLERIRQSGVKAVLVASALHDGRLRREDVAERSLP